MAHPWIRQLCEISRSDVTVTSSGLGTDFGLGVHCELDLRDTTLVQGHDMDTFFGYACTWKTDFRYVCTVTLTV